MCSAIQSDHRQRLTLPVLLGGGRLGRDAGERPSNPPSCALPLPPRTSAQILSSFGDGNFGIPPKLSGTTFHAIGGVSASGHMGVQKVSSLFLASGLKYPPRWRSFRELLPCPMNGFATLGENVLSLPVYEIEAFCSFIFPKMPELPSPTHSTASKSATTRSLGIGNAFPIP